MDKLKQLEKKLMKKAFPKNAVVGTGIFSYKDKCSNCGKIKMVDINAECRSCEKDMRKFRRRYS